MPLYEYLCRACDRKFEAYLRAWGDKARCPACQGDAVERLLSAFAVGGAGERAPSAAAGGGSCCGGGCGCHS
jgi:putative FmdB family regulatory protein